MSLLGRIARFFGLSGRASTAEERSATQLGFGAGGYISRYAAPRSKREWAAEWETNAHVRAPFGRVATDSAMVPWRLYRKTKRGKTEVEDHAILDLLANPCPGFTMKKWIELNLLYLDLHGEFFLGVESAENGDPVCLRPIPPHWVTQTPTPSDPFYTVSVPGSVTKKIRPDWVIWHSSARPLNPYGRGAGLAASLDDEVAQLENMAQYNEAFFGNGCTLGQVLGVEGAQDWKKVREQFESRHAGVANSHRLAVIPGKITLSNPLTTHKDLDFNQGVKSQRDFVRQTVGTPPEIHGQTENSNKATAQAAENLHQGYGMRPRLEEFGQALNVYLLPLFAGSDRLFLQYCNPVAKTDEFRLDRVERNTKSGIMTLNEGRHEQDLDPDPNGDVYFVPLNMRVIRKADLGRYAELQLLEAENRAKNPVNNAKNDQKSDNSSQKSLPGYSLDQYIEEVSRVQDF